MKEIADEIVYLDPEAINNYLLKMFKPLKPTKGHPNGKPWVHKFSWSPHTETTATDVMLRGES